MTRAFVPTTDLMGFLVDSSLAVAAGLDHDMVPMTHSEDTALYVCRRCRLAFTIGHQAHAQDRRHSPRLKVVTDSALTTECHHRRMRPQH